MNILPNPVPFFNPEPVSDERARELLREFLPRVEAESAFDAGKSLWQPARLVMQAVLDREFNPSSWAIAVDTAGEIGRRKNGEPRRISLHWSDTQLADELASDIGRLIP